MNYNFEQSKQLRSSRQVIRGMFTFTAFWLISGDNLYRLISTYQSAVTHHIMEF